MEVTKGDLFTGMCAGCEDSDILLSVYVGHEDLQVSVHPFIHLPMCVGCGDSQVSTLVHLYTLADVPWCCQMNM